MYIKVVGQDYIDAQNGRSGCVINSNTLIDDFKGISLKIDKSWNILDIGCRNCQILGRLWKSGYKNIYGVDIGELAEKTWENLPYKSNLKRCDIHDGIPFNVKFDLITISHTLEHLYDPFSVRQLIYNSLTESGLLHSIAPIESESDFIKNHSHVVRFVDHEEHMKFWSHIGIRPIYHRFYNTNSAIICRKKY